MNIFGSESGDSDDDVSFENNFNNLAFIDIMLRKSLNKADLDILLYSKSNEGMVNLSKLKARLSAAKFENISCELNPEVTSLYDVIVYFDLLSFPEVDRKVIDQIDLIEKRLLPGGTMISQVDCDRFSVTALFPQDRWNILASGPSSNIGLQFVRTARRSIPVNIGAGCNWASTDIGYELSALDSVTVCLSSSERRSGGLSPSSLTKAVAALRDEGVCIFRGLVATSIISAWGRVFEVDFKVALEKLGSRGMSLVRPAEGVFIPNFYELSMREAARCDLRNSPSVAQHRASVAGDDVAALKRHPVVMSVLNEVMNPDGPEELAMGNWGRWNFNGQGPIAKPPLAASDVGAIMTVPGCADQTIHADTPHLFVSSTHLPPHYVNMFLPAVSRPCQADINVGQTAFVLGSHKLDVSARVMAQAGGEAELGRRLVRPHMATGDVLLFDCRVLHFGLANTSTDEDAVRTMLYVNFHQTWFSDPKNWNHEERLFGDVRS